MYILHCPKNKQIIWQNSLRPSKRLNSVYYFVRFLGNIVSRKIAYEIYWPLDSWKIPAFHIKINQHLPSKVVPLSVIVLLWWSSGCNKSDVAIAKRVIPRPVMTADDTKRALLLNFSKRKDPRTWLATLVMLKMMVPRYCNNGGRITYQPTHY